MTAGDAVNTVRDAYLVHAVGLELLAYRVRPVLHLLERHMRAADKTQLWLCVLVLPDDRIVILHALKLRIVNDVHLRALLDERLAMLLGFGS